MLTRLPVYRALPDPWRGWVVEQSDVVVVLVRHDAIDWTTIFWRAGLVLDTVNASRRLAFRPRRVLRLGAGCNA